LRLVGYRSTQLVNGNTQFVLGASHIAGATEHRIEEHAQPATDSA